MSDIDNGGAAFPVVHPDGLGVQYFGLSIRDYFAAKALQSILALGDMYDYEGLPAVEALPIHAYALADAMLKARGES